MRIIPAELANLDALAILDKLNTLPLERVLKPLLNNPAATALMRGAVCEKLFEITSTKWLSILSNAHYYYLDAEDFVSAEHVFMLYLSRAISVPSGFVFQINSIADMIINHIYKSHFMTTEVIKVFISDAIIQLLQSSVNWFIFPLLGTLIEKLLNNNPSIDRLSIKIAAAVYELYPSILHDENQIVTCLSIAKSLYLQIDALVDAENIDVRLNRRVENKDLYAAFKLYMTEKTRLFVKVGGLELAGQVTGTKPMVNVESDRPNSNRLFVMRRSPDVQSDFSDTASTASTYSAG